MAAIWFGVLLLLTALGGYLWLPGWWRGTRTSNLPDRRQRVFLPGVLAVALLLLFGVAAGLVDKHSQPRWLAWAALVLLAAGVLVLVLLPLVAFLSAFDFAVPPWLRRGAPPRPVPAVAPVSPARPARKRSRREPPKPADGNGFLRITRPANAWRDFARKFIVEVDGGEVGRLRRGGDLRLELPAGIHTVRGVFGSASSPAIRVPLASGGTTLVKLRPSVGEATGKLLIEVAEPPVRRAARKRPGRRVTR